MNLVVKRDGRVVEFSVEKIVAAISKTLLAVEISRADVEIAEIMDQMEMENGSFNPELYEKYIELEDMRLRLRYLWRAKTAQVSAMIYSQWLQRNAGVGRNNTSAVSDKMLLIIPTPPTAEIANRSLLQRGGADGAVV